MTGKVSLFIGFESEATEVVKFTLKALSNVQGDEGDKT